MRKFTIGVIAAVVIAGLAPGVARATDTTTASDNVATTPTTAVPVACAEALQLMMVGLPGPSRALHQPTRPAIALLPDCDDIEGVCVTVLYPGLGGPARLAHRTGGTTPVEVPCEPVDEACDITVDLATYTGPARAAHQPAVDPDPIPSKKIMVEIPQECQDALSLAALPTTGSDSGNILWLGALLVINGGVLIGTSRAVAVRAR